MTLSSLHRSHAVLLCSRSGSALLLLWRRHLPNDKDTDAQQGQPVLLQECLFRRRRFRQAGGGICWLCCWCCCWIGSIRSACGTPLHMAHGGVEAAHPAIWIGLCTSTLIPSGDMVRPPAVTGGHLPVSGAFVLIEREVGRSCERCSWIRGGVDRKHYSISYNGTDDLSVW